jgi:hypothetical protein
MSLIAPKVKNFQASKFFMTKHITPATVNEPDTSRRHFLKLSAGASLTGAVVATALTGCGGSDGDVVSDASLPLELPTASFSDERSILSEPILQNPSVDSIRVVWFSEIADGRHSVRVGSSFDIVFEATTTLMSHMLEDSGSQVYQMITGTWTEPRPRNVYRHEALVKGLTSGQRTPYVAISEKGSQAWKSGQYSLQPLPQPGQGLKILLTSDHQNNPMCSANMEEFTQKVGIVDAVFFAGDFVSQPNRASEWFDRVGGNGNSNFAGNPSFFQSFQGTAHRWNPGAPYAGAQVLQYAPLYGCLGNHEYPGRWRMDSRTNNANNPQLISINNMDNDPQPKWYAEIRYEEVKAVVNPSNDTALRQQWIEDNSYEWTTYREMWSLPEGAEGKAYYAQRFGDIFIISLDANRVWRTWSSTERGKFTERFINAEGRVTQNADEWGFGDINFRAFGKGSLQYQWLEQTLQSEDCRSARYRIVVSHQTMAGLGDNAVPVQAEIRSTVELTDGSLIGPMRASEWAARWPEVRAALNEGRVRFVRHDYPLAQDQWLTDIEPLLLKYGVNLVHTGHSHLWNRTVAAGSLHYLESSNFGNSFGAMFFTMAQQGVSASQGPRNGGNVPGSADWVAQTTQPVAANLGGLPRTALTWNSANYPIAGEVHGRPMAMPTDVNPMRTIDRRTVSWNEQDLPFVASNNICTFSVLDTSTGLITSYCFDTRNVSNEVLKFDEFQIG